MIRSPIREPAPLDLTCNATPTVTGQVRLLIDCRLPDWGLPAERHARVRANLHLIATELVGNAVQETPDQRIRTYCAPDFDAGVIQFAVWDSSARKPAANLPELRRLGTAPGGGSCRELRGNPSAGRQIGVGRR
jgi:hypothetical protein